MKNTYILLNFLIYVIQEEYVMLYIPCIYAISEFQDKFTIFMEQDCHDPHTNPEITGSREIFSIFMEWDSHNSICGIKCFLYPITMMYINIYIQNTLVISVKYKQHYKCKMTVYWCLSNQLQYKKKGYGVNVKETTTNSHDQTCIKKISVSFESGFFSAENILCFGYM